MTMGVLIDIRQDWLLKAIPKRKELTMMKYHSSSGLYACPACREDLFARVSVQPGINFKDFRQIDVLIFN